jgi:hypothetical protein
MEREERSLRIVEAFLICGKLYPSPPRGEGKGEEKNLSCTPMRYMKWIGLAAAALMVYACFSPWVIIESKNIVVSGMDASGTNFGKPGYLHLFLTALFLLFHFIPRLWAKRANLPVVAVNMGWTIRNFFVIAACRAGECPEKQTGLWLTGIASLLMLLAALFPDIKLDNRKK